MAHPLCRRAWDAPFLLSGVLFILVTTFGCGRFNESLNRGLEEEKSYTRHAMEYHREHPDQRRGDTVLEVWSKADNIAQSVKKESIAGSWARFSDQFQFLPERLLAKNRHYTSNPVPRRRFAITCDNACSQQLWSFGC